MVDWDSSGGIIHLGGWLQQFQDGNELLGRDLACYIVEQMRGSGGVDIECVCPTVFAWSFSCI